MIIKKGSNFMFVSSILSSSLESTTNITPLDFIYSHTVNLHKTFQILKIKIQ